MTIQSPVSSIIGSQYDVDVRDSEAVAIGEGARATINHYNEIIIRLDNFEDQPPVPGEAPYKGMAYFTEADKDIYFGREKLSIQLADHLQTTHFLALIGASGSGKSSLLRAGVIPLLRRHNWRIHVIQPGVHPITTLATTLTPDAMTPAAMKEMEAALYNDPETLAFFGAKLAGATNAERLLLAVDQFEELFSQCKDHAEQAAFVSNLVHAAQSQGSTTILISMRADFYHRVSEFPALTDLVSRQQEYVKPMAQEDLVRVIAEPAKRGGWQFVEGLVEQIVDDVGREPGRMPLLSHALLETWERRRGVIMTLNGYRASGGVEGAIAQTAQMTLDKLVERNLKFEAITREIFLNLTELGEGSEDTRRIAKRAELSAGVDETAFNIVLEALVRARLITTGDGEVEVAHEALIRRWPTLREWIADNRERLRFERQLGRDATLWHTLDHDTGMLYRGLRLLQVEDALNKETLQLNSISHEFVEASIEARKAEIQAVRRRQLRNMAGLLVSALVIAVTITLALTGNLNRLIYRPLSQQASPVTIPAGKFLMGASDENIAFADSIEETDFEEENTFYRLHNEQPQHEVFIDAFAIDRFEVTNREFEQCVKATMCTPPSNTFFADSSYSDWPVTHVNWEQSSSYCDWIGGRLPTEAEWEKAARFGNDSAEQHYAWGEAYDASKANVFIGIIGSPMPVGSFSPAGDTSVGLADMTGNVWEWVSDWYAEDYYANSPSSNPDGPRDGYWRVARGGSYDNDWVKARITYRDSSFEPSDVAPYLGFRCVR